MRVRNFYLTAMLASFGAGLIFATTYNGLWVVAFTGTGLFAYLAAKETNS